MTKTKKLILFLVVILVLIAGALFAWKEVKAPTKEPSTTTQTQAPAQTPTPTPEPTQTNGIIYGTADTTTLHITKIDLYDASGKNLVTSAAIDASGTYSLTVPAGGYMIDYEASPDLYPHSKESVSVTAGASHEVDYLINSD